MTSTSNLKFYLLSSPESKSKHYNYLKEQLTQRNIFFSEVESIEDTVNQYYQDEENSFIFLDIMSSLSSFELQNLKGTKLYCVFQCKYELIQTKKRIQSQRVKEICIKGQNILKCISLFSFITNFDPIVEINSISAGHVNARLGCSEAFIHFELQNPELQQGYRYCVDTDSESICYMIFNHNPVQEMVTKEINQFISDELNLRDNIQENEYLTKVLYLKRMGELCQIALEKQTSIKVKPIFISKQIQQEHEEKLKAAINEQQQQLQQNLSTPQQNTQSTTTITDNCIEDSKIVYKPNQQQDSQNSKLNNLFGEKVQFCTTGTAAINQEALLEPLKKLSNAHLSSFYTTSKTRGQEFYQRTIVEGVNYYQNLDHLVKSFDGVAYIPSLPGTRKENEMIAFINSNKNTKNIVLAEKPAFANYQSAKNFLQISQQAYQTQNQQEQLQQEVEVNKTETFSRISNRTPQLKDRIFIGWHYIHHPAIQEVVKRIQDNHEFGQIKQIHANFVRPKPFSTSGRIFEPKQGGCGLDRFCYPLHFALTLAKFQVSNNESADESQFTSELTRKQSFQIIEASHLNYNEIYNQENPLFEHLEGRLESTLKLNQSIDVHLYSSMETNETFYSEARVVFENNTEIKFTWFVHPHHQIRDFNLYCVSIKYPNKKAFQPFNYKEKFDKTKSSYDYQIEYMRDLKNGSTLYDTNEDRFNLCVESNTYLQLVLDNIFTHSGLKIKEGL